MKRIVLFTLMITCMSMAHAQKEGNIWYFGNGAGLNFNNTPPTPLTGALFTTEGCASIADPLTGQLLFYTDGITVWDRTHTPMAASVATPLFGDPSSTQSGVIVPKPGSNNLYYVFTTPAQAGWVGASAAMCYSVVDMNLNGGNGDLISINTPIIDSTTEKIAVVGNCDRSAYWIVGHRWNCDSFYAFKLTAAGLAPPVKSKTGIVHTDGGTNSALESIGYMKFSPNGKKLGLVTYVNSNTVELFDFNFSTGILSNPITDPLGFDLFNPSDGPYGCSFSPDNSKFYVSWFSFNAKIYQYDLNAGSAAGILASRTVVGTPTAGIIPWAIQNGPNGKMYVATGNTNTLDVINNPNALGAACGYTAAAQSIGTNMCLLGLPGMVESFLAPGAAVSFVPPPGTPVCKGDTVFAPQAAHNAFTVTPGTGVSVNADSSLFAFAPAVTTTYKVISSGICGSGDTVTFTVRVSAGPTADFVFDPAKPDVNDPVILLRNKSRDASLYAWYNSDNVFLSSDKDYHLPNPGEGEFCYTLIARDSVNCADTVKKCVTVEKAGIIFIPNSFSPNGDGNNDVFKVYGVNIQLENFSVFNRYGERVFYTTDINRGWDGKYKSALCDMGTYYYLVRYRNSEGEKLTMKGDVGLLR